MKKLFATLLAITLAMTASIPAKAIEDPYQKGTVIAGAYFGVWPGIGASITADYTITNLWKGHLTGGIMATWNRQVYRDYDYDLLTGDYIITRTPMQKICIAPRATYGLNITKQFEVHAGVALGVGIPIKDSPVAFVSRSIGSRESAMMLRVLLTALPYSNRRTPSVYLPLCASCSTSPQLRMELNSP